MFTYDRFTINKKPILFNISESGAILEGLLVENEQGKLDIESLPADVDALRERLEFLFAVRGFPNMQIEKDEFGRLSVDPTTFFSFQAINPPKREFDFVDEITVDRDRKYLYVTPEVPTQFTETTLPKAQPMSFDAAHAPKFVRIADVLYHQTQSAETTGKHYRGAFFKRIPEKGLTGDHLHTANKIRKVLQHAPVYERTKLLASNSTLRKIYHAQPFQIQPNLNHLEAKLRELSLTFSLPEEPRVTQSGLK